MTIADPEPLFWKNLIKGLEAEPLDPAPIKGISGVDHQVLGLGVDKARNRLILVLPEPHARSAAMAQVDIQAALGAKIHVVVARPVHINLTAAALELVSLAGGKDITSKKFTELPDESKSLVVQSISKVSKITNQAYPGMLPLIGQIVDQISLIDFNVDAAGDDDVFMSLGKLLSTDLVKQDREFGICGLPLFDFDDDQIELIASGSSIDDVVSILDQQGIRQYFFPPSDQLILGLVDRGVNTKEAIGTGLSLAPTMGHPLGKNEILPPDIIGLGAIDALDNRRILHEAEFGMELTPAGTSYRSHVKIKPREGLFSKLISRINVNIDLSLKDFFKP